MIVERGPQRVSAWPLDLEMLERDASDDSSFFPHGRSLVSFEGDRRLGDYAVFGCIK